MIEPGSSPPVDPRIGTTLGGYRIDGVAGRGAMGVVYRAWDPSLDRPVALKLLPPALSDDDAFRQRFLRETRLAAAIDHPNIIPIYEAGEDGGVLFLAMRLVDGVDLEHRLSDGPLDVAETVALLGPVARALDVAHTRGLVHRDVKPANILVGDDPSGTPSVYLSDFGLTKQRASESGLTRTGSFLGTVEYMAPEQIDGRPVDGATDQYALAATAYRCLTGHVPFERDTPIAMAMAHLKEPPPRVTQIRADIAPAVDEVIARGMAKDPTDRFPTCRDLIGSLERAGNMTPPVEMGRRQWNVPRAAVAIALVALIAFGGSLAASGALGPRVTPAPSLVAAASGSPAASPTDAPSSNAFPTAAEQKLLDELPPILQKSCVRGRGKVDLVAAGFAGKVTGSRSGSGPSFIANQFDVLPGETPVASIECRPTVGASGAWFLWYGLTGGVDATSPAQVAVTSIATHFNAPDADCAKPPARGSWRSSSGASGYATCLKDSGPGGQPWIYWSFGTAHVLGVATAPAGQYQALYDWWQSLTPFLQ